MYNTPKNFIAGKLSRFIENWQTFTSDNWICNTVVGYEIEFGSIPPLRPVNTWFSTVEVSDALDNLLVDFFNKKIIIPFISSEGFCSSIFTVRKRD